MVRRSWRHEPGPDTAPYNGRPIRFTWGARLPRAVGARASVILLLSYLLGFALPVLGAVQSLVVQTTNGHLDSHRQSVVGALVADVIVLAIALFAAALGMRSARQPPLRVSWTDLGLRRTQHLSRQWAAVTALLYVTVLLVATTGTRDLLDLVGVHGSGAPGVSGQPLAAELVDASWAGWKEEPILLGLTFALARRARWRWPVVVTVMIVMRIAFHLYYGVGSLFVLPWVLAAYVLYRRCPLLWPFVVGHGVFDVLQVLYNDGPSAVSHTASLTADALAVIGVCTALWLLWRHLRAEGVRLLDVLGKIVRDP